MFFCFFSSIASTFLVTPSIAAAMGEKRRKTQKVSSTLPQAEKLF